MSDVNKLDDADLKCPLDPNQYNIGVDNITVPAGSFAWAISLVYVGKFVRRNGWNAQVEYIKLLPGSMDNNVLPQIGIVDKKGTTSWQPTQKDMMACDWGLVSKVTPVECMLSFDLKVGTDHNDLGEQSWGYLADEEWVSVGEYPFGDLTNFQNKTDIKSFSLFVGWSTGAEIEIRVSSDKTQDGYQKMKELFGKNLTITSNGISYSLGRATVGHSVGQKDYEFDGLYQNNDALKLSALLQQNIGNTLSFCFNWE